MKNIMKALILCLCLSFVLVSFSACGDNKGVNDTDGENESMLQDDGGEETEDILENEYDEAGNLIKEPLYNADGEYIGYKQYSYLEGRLFNCVIFNADDDVIEEDQYDETGKIFWWIKYEYEDGVRVKGVSHDGSYIIYHYDEDGRESGMTYYDAQGNITDEVDS